MTSFETPARDEDVQAHNDRLAREHDIDDYYARSSLAIRLVERRRLSVIRRLVGPAAGLRILEIGCGGGHVLRLFPRATLVGVDVSAVMLDKARRNLAGLGAELHHGQIGDLDLADRSFDRIICTEVLEHVIDPELLLSHARRLLRPGGRAVITFPNDRLIQPLKDAMVRTGLSRWPPFRRISWGGDEYHLHV
ncbi:MAG: class I SAM-dependent methyltransferase, partial [Deltaproteobacteria bacterium]|nr:class I SAM-dependent methyltransferase [Deltaproteobacteria bacterium]MBW2535964.1 class I SAM-dependent methyltransferase [Deltaproteobacteria bacterium]